MHKHWWMAVSLALAILVTPAWSNNKMTGARTNAQIPALTIVTPSNAKCTNTDDSFTTCSYLRFWLRRHGVAWQTRTNAQLPALTIVTPTTRRAQTLMAVSLNLRLQFWLHRHGVIITCMTGARTNCADSSLNNCFPLSLYIIVYYKVNYQLLCTCIIWFVKVHICFHS